MLININKNALELFSLTSNTLFKKKLKTIVCINGSNIKYKGPTNDCAYVTVKFFLTNQYIRYLLEKILPND